MLHHPLMIASEWLCMYHILARTPSPVQAIKFTIQGRAQEHSATMPRKSCVQTRKSVDQDLTLGAKYQSEALAVDAICKISHQGSLVMELEFIGKPEDLNLWSLIRESITYAVYACLLHISCKNNGGIKSFETKCLLRLYFAGKHNSSSHLVQIMLAGARVPNVGGLTCYSGSNSRDIGDR
jgi:hypothetical protein